MRLIHPSAWKGNSANFGCRIPHNPDLRDVPEPRRSKSASRDDHNMWCVGHRCRKLVLVLMLRDLKVLTEISAHHRIALEMA